MSKRKRKLDKLSSLNQKRKKPRKFTLNDFNVEQIEPMNGSNQQQQI